MIRTWLCFHNEWCSLTRSALFHFLRQISLVLFLRRERIYIGHVCYTIFIQMDVSDSRFVHLECLFPSGLGPVTEPVRARECDSIAEQTLLGNEMLESNLWPSDGNFLHQVSSRLMHTIHTGAHFVRIMCVKSCIWYSSLAFSDVVMCSPPSRPLPGREGERPWALRSIINLKSAVNRNLNDRAPLSHVTDEWLRVPHVTRTFRGFSNVRLVLLLYRVTVLGFRKAPETNPKSSIT